METAKKVFLLDDDKIFLKFYQSLLVAKGYDVFATDNAYKFLLYAKEVHPDVIMMDYNMPKMDGIEVIDNIKKINSLRLVPIIMASTMENKNIAEEKGIKFLSKPIDVNELFDVIEKSEVLIN